MAVQFDWDGFDANVAASIVDTLNNMITQQLNKHLTAEVTQDGMFDITQMEVVALDLGSTAPDIRLMEFEDAGFQHNGQYDKYVSSAQTQLEEHEQRKERRKRKQREKKAKLLKQLQKKEERNLPLKQMQQDAKIVARGGVDDSASDQEEENGDDDEFASNSVIDDEMLSAVGIPIVPAGYIMGQQGRQFDDRRSTMSMITTASSVLRFAPLSTCSVAGPMQSRMRRRAGDRFHNSDVNGQQQMLQAKNSAAAFSLAEFGIQTQHVPRAVRSKRHKAPARTIAQAELSAEPRRAYSVYDFEKKHSDDKVGVNDFNASQASLRSLAKAHQPPTRIRSMDANGQLLQRRRISSRDIDSFSDHSDSNELDVEAEMKLLKEDCLQRQENQRENPASLPLGLDIDDIFGPGGLKIKTYFCYNGNASIDIEIELAVNIPTPAFVSMPVALKVTHMHIEGELVIIYQDDTVRVFFERPERRPYGPLKDFELTVKMGNEQQEGGKALVDKSVVGEFVKGQVQKILEQRIVFPHIFTLPDIHKGVIEKMLHSRQQEQKQQEQED